MTETGSTTSDDGHLQRDFSNLPSSNEESIMRRAVQGFNILEGTDLTVAQA